MGNSQATEQASALPPIRDRTPSPSSGTEDAPRSALELSESIAQALHSIEYELGGRIWLFTDPERRKALSRARDFLQRLRERVDLVAGEEVTISRGEVSAAVELVRRASDPKIRYGRENAWDLAEELRVTSLSWLPDAGLACVLENEGEDSEGMIWSQVFPRTELDRLLKVPRPADFRASALEHLRRLHHERVELVRHDRARDKLWQHFVWKLIPVVIGLVVLGLVVRRDYLPAVAGALGAILSAVLKLRDGQQRIRTLRRSASFLYLQPLIGAIAAQFMVWLGVRNVITIAGPDVQIALGFLAGFSEPFFLGTIARLTEAGSKPTNQATENGASTSPHSPTSK